MHVSNSLHIFTRINDTAAASCSDCPLILQLTSSILMQNLSHDAAYACMRSTTTDRP